MVKRFNFQRCIEVLVVILPMIAIGCGSSHQLLSKDSVTWYSMKEAQQLAKKQNKKVLIYAEASWCGFCRQMDKKVFPQQSVIDSLESYYYPVKIDIESGKTMVFNGQEITEQKFARKNRIQATPTTFFISPDGEILGTQPGFIPPDTFSRLLAYVGKERFRVQEFKDYLNERSVE